MTERQIQKVKQKISQARSILRKEKRMHGWYDDSFGRRYIIAELYMQIQDYKGLIRYHKWFWQEFPDDVGFPELHLSWIIAGFKERKYEIAFRHLVSMEDVNAYVVPLLLGEKAPETDKWKGMSISQPQYAKRVVGKASRWIDDEILANIKKIVSQPDYADFTSRVLAIRKQLIYEESGPKRSQLLEEEKKIIRDYIDCGER